MRPEIKAADCQNCYLPKNRDRKIKSGYLYVLVHPSDPKLYKIGITTREIKHRLERHNNDFTKIAGQVVKESGQKWELKEYISVPDPYWAETVFWGATGLADVPFRRGIEVERMEWEWVIAGLNAAKKAGMRPPPKPRTKPVRNRGWMIKQLEGTGITMLGTYRGLVTGVKFQCNKGHIFNRSAGVVAYGKSCPYCAIEKSD